MGEPHTMNRRLIAQSGTFAVPGLLDVPVEDILSDRDQENILAKIVLANSVREVGMRELTSPPHRPRARSSPTWTAWRNPCAMSWNFTGATIRGPWKNITRNRMWMV